MVKRGPRTRLRLIPDPLAQAAPPRAKPVVGQLPAVSADDLDDIRVPPPRVAKDWYCTECGRAGGVPDQGYLQIDRRYNIGRHECTKGRVQLVADFHWDQATWGRTNEQRSMYKAFMKEQAGQKMSEEEVKLANRYRLKIGMRTNQEARDAGR